MSNTAIGDALDAAITYLSEHPKEARYTDSEARAILEAGLAVTVTGPDGALLRTDMPKSVGGAGSAPSPGWLLRAAQEGLTPRRIEVIVDSESDDRGILGIDDSVPAGPLSSHAVVRVEHAGAAPDKVDAVVRWAEIHCPVQDAVRRAVPCSVEVGRI